MARYRAKPSVVFMNRVYPPSRGASGRVLRDLAMGFAHDGWDVTILTTGNKEAREKDGPLKILRVKAPLKGRTIHGYFKVWFKLLRAGRAMPAPDLLVTLTDPPLLVCAGANIARKHKCKHIHWCHDLYPDIIPALKITVPDFALRFFKKRSVRAMKSCDKIVAIGRYMGRRLTHSGIEPPKVAVIPNWPDYELLDPPEPKKGRGVKKVKGARPFDEQLKGGSGPKFRVLYAGNMGRAHPIRTILMAAEKLSDKQADIEFVFIGDGHNYDRLAKERSKRGLDNIRFLPFQPLHNLREVMQTGDLHLVTMRQESAGMMVPSKFYSALAVERPCVLLGPRKTEIAEVIDDYGCGDIVDQNDVDGLVDVIMSYRSDSDKWLRAYEGARKAGEIFVPEASIQAWLERARGVINRPKVLTRKRRKPVTKKTKRKVA